MIHNISLANATAQAIQEQQESLTLLTKLVMDNQIALGCLCAGRTGWILCCSQHLLVCVHQQFAEGPDQVEKTLSIS